jgi:glucose/arabinose dehydrogenase
MGRLVWVAAGCAAVCACGGGDGGTSPPPGNRPPTFISPASVSVQDGATGTIYTAAATDPDGGALTFSISGGLDAGDFSINGSTGALSFVTPPDFEAPADSDANNVYMVTLRVADTSAASATLALTVTVTSGGGGLQVRRVGTGFAEPLFLTGLTDGSGRVYVVEKGGLIWILDPQTTTKSAAPFIDLRSEVSTDGERGLLGFALAPDFATSRRFYVYITNPAGDIELRCYLVSASNPNVADLSTEDVLLVIDHPSATNHNGGWIGFDAAGFLYLATGDGGSTPGNAQSGMSLLGKILRIDVRGDDFPGDDSRDYAIPPDNPFFGSMSIANEIWLMGLRNPFRASIDPVTGDLFIGDVGQSAIEEIDRVRPGDKGANLGWAFFEGTQAFQGTPPAGFQHFQPSAQYGRSSGGTVIGGYVYRGPAAALQGQYVFGDFVSGNLWSVPATSLVPGGPPLQAAQFTNRNADFAPDVGNIAAFDLVSFGVDAAGNLYMVDINQGEVFRIEEGG